MNRYHLILIVCSLVVFGVAMRLLPHAPNLTPVTALAFVAARYLGRQWSFIIPGVTLIVSDAVIGFYDWRLLLSVYGSFALIALLSWTAMKYRNVFSATLAIVSSSILFFLITNTAVWAFSPWYEKTFSGLLYSYELGLPFLRNMLTGDLFYTIALVLLFEICLMYRRYGHSFLMRRIHQPTTSLVSEVNS